MMEGRAMTVDTRELVEAEAAYLEAQAEAFRRRAAELRVLLKDDQDTELIAKLEGLPWVAARSGKCDYVKNAPLELVEAVRATKGGIKGDSYHFTASTTEPTLFRFARKRGEAQ